MIPYSCATCGQMLFFHNSACLRCESDVAYDPLERRLDAVHAVGEGDSVLRFVSEPSGEFRRCANHLIARCNWLVPVAGDEVEADADADALCTSCRLTTVRPDDGDEAGLAAFADAEGAKRRLLDQLAALGLPVVGRYDDPEKGLAFEFLSSRNRPVTTGHSGGLITLDLSESDDAHRAFVQQQLGEPYRTVLGHLRHEIGHYYWPMLVESEHPDEFRDLFGDPSLSYEDALERHYADQDDADDSWTLSHVSRYATMHPWEDWAETFAHYLHIRGGLETATSFGLRLGDPTLAAALDAYRIDRDIEVGSTVQAWLAVTLALNAMSRSIGQGDLYPFVLSETVIDKLDFVHRVVGTADAADASTPSG